MLSRRMLARINARPREINRSRLAAIGAGSLALSGVLFVVVSSPPLALVALLAGVVGVLGAYMAQKAGSITSLTYGDLEGDLAIRFSAVREACKDLASSEKIWRLGNDPGQRNLKASDIYFPPEREPARVGLLEMPGIKVNIPIWGIDAGAEKIHFFPEGVLIYREEHYKAVSYKSFKVAFSPVRFFEDEELPEDAEVVDRTWRFTRDDGSPDRRYTPNPQIPVVLYGLLRLTGPSGLDVSLQVSNSAAAARFARAFGARKRNRTHEKDHRRAATESGKQERVHLSEQERAESLARRTLGVTDDASIGEIAAAYRKLARSYHPDKVANLPHEVREFADKKMKEINAAYAELKRQSKLRPPVFGGEPAKSEE